MMIPHFFFVWIQMGCNVEIKHFLWNLAGDYTVMWFNVTIK